MKIQITRMDQGIGNYRKIRIAQHLKPAVVKLCGSIRLATTHIGFVLLAQQTQQVQFVDPKNRHYSARQADVYSNYVQAVASKRGGRLCLYL